MPNKKNTTKKTTVKKTASKPNIKPAATSKIAAEPKAKQSTLLSWFFVPDMSQGWRGWILRAGLFVIGFFAFILMFGAIGMQVKFAELGMGAVPFWTAVKLILIGFSETPLQIVVIATFLSAIGAFMFMPRRHLDKRGFFAIFATFTLWLMLSAGAIALFEKFGESLKGADFLLMPLSLVFIGAFTGMLASVVCFARKLGVSRTALFLSFPFGFGLYEYSGYFLPSKDKTQIVKIKFGWYGRFVDFMLGNRIGQILLAAASLFLVAIMPYPSEIFMVVFFAGLYFWKGADWLSANIKRLSRVAVLANVLMLAHFGVYFWRNFNHLMTMI